MKPTRLPIIPLAVPVQLVLGLDCVGIERPRKRRRAKAPHPWAPRPVEKAA